MSRFPDFSTRPDARQRGRGLEPVALFASALLLAASLLSAAQAAWERRATDTGLSGLRREAAAARERLAALDARSRANGHLLGAQLVWTAEAPPGRLLAELAALLPPDVRLEGVVFTYGPRLEIEAEVVARRVAGYDLFLERLAASPLFFDVLPGAETREGEMRASVRMGYGRWP